MCGGNFPLVLFWNCSKELPNWIWEDRWPTDMVKQAEIKRPAKNGVARGTSMMEVADATAVNVLIRAPVLVLNLNYVPVNICTVRRAIVLLAKGKAERLESHLGYLHTVDQEIDAPSIIRLDYMVKRPFVPRKLSKKEVFLRDKYTCQYYGKKPRDLTLDHVIPRRQHGPHTWENVVAACNGCNLHKAGRTPEEAKMRLGTKPKAPDPNPYLILQNRVILDEWKVYIPWSIRDENGS